MHATLLVLLIAVEWFLHRSPILVRSVSGASDWTAARAQNLRRVSKPNLVSSGPAYPDLVEKLGIDAEPLHCTIETDGLGHRNRPNKGEAEILCLGDSLLFARLVPIEQILTERIEASIGRVVLNVSEPGYSPQEALLRMRMSSPELVGKLIVQFIFEGNDLSDSIRWRQWCNDSGFSFLSSSVLLARALDRLKWANPDNAKRRRGDFREAQDSRGEVYFFHDARKRRGFDARGRRRCGCSRPGGARPHSSRSRVRGRLPTDEDHRVARLL